MNVMHLQLSGGPGGIVVLCRDINRVSKQNNFFYFVFEGGCIADDIAEDGGIVFTAAEPHQHYLQAAKRFVQYCKQNQIDVILDHTGSPVTRFFHIYAAKRLPNVRFILYLHSVAERHRNSGWKSKALRILTRHAYRHSAYAAAISECVKNSYMDTHGFDAQKTVVVYNGVDVDRFYRGRPDASGFRLIYVGRLLPIKGIAVLLRAIGLLQDKASVNLDLVGSGPEDYVNKLQQLAAELQIQDRVTFHGARNDIPDCLAHADLFVHPAVCEEGFGITLAEAMAASLPCIAFHKGAIPEIISNGYNGWIVEETTPKALAQAIDHARQSWKNGSDTVMRENARQSAERFSITNTVRQLEALYP